MNQRRPVSSTSNNFRAIRIIGAFILVVGIAVIGILWQFTRVSEALVESTAIEGAARSTRILQEFRSLYTSEVVNRLENQDITITHAYTATDRAIPLPATLTILLGAKVNDSGGGARLYSDYPFPWRTDGGIQDDFQRDALEALRRNPNQPFVRFEEANGHTTLRYATADQMRPGCVSCHNTHPSSPKTDWKVGDVRGVLEIVRPLDTVTVQVREGLWQTFFLIVGGAIAVLALLGFIFQRLYTTTDQLQIAKEQAETSHDQLKIELEERSRTEFERTKLQDTIITLQAAMVEELSTPLIPINDQIVVMPLIGRMNEERARKVMTALLEGIAAKRAHVAIIDITGLSILDPASITLLLQAIQGVRLLGAKVVLTGIQTDMALQLVHLGLDWHGVTTCQTLQMGIAYATDTL